MWLFLAFVAVPLIEIALFLKVGGLIGLWPTLGLVLLTALAGTALVHREGRRALADLRNSFNEMRDPAEPLAHGAMILLAGLLLLTPGFFTDTLGLLLLVPAVRIAVMRQVSTRVSVTHFGMAGGTRAPRRDPHRPDVIDGDFQEIDPDSAPPRNSPGAPPRGPSGWTQG